jgi:hypothetical protein
MDLGQGSVFVVNELLLKCVKRGGSRSIHSRERLFSALQIYGSQAPIPCFLNPVIYLDKAALSSARKKREYQCSR